MLTATSLVRKGYFPKEVPPAFTSEPLADAYSDTANPLDLGGKDTDCVRHNLARSSGHRRPLKVPNPRSYIHLAQSLEALWIPIENAYGSDGFALSQPVVATAGERAIETRTSLGREPELRAETWRGQKFVLRADVSQFYSSIYTHAIPWALHGKAHAKAHAGQTAGDRVDKAVKRVLSSPNGRDPDRPRCLGRNCGADPRGRR